MPNWGIWRFFQRFLIAFRLIRGITWSDLLLEIELIGVRTEKSGWKEKRSVPFFHWKKNIDWFLQWLEHNMKFWGYRAKKTWPGSAHRIAGKQASRQTRIQWGEVYSQSSCFDKSKRNARNFQVYVCGGDSAWGEGIQRWFTLDRRPGSWV